MNIIELIFPMIGNYKTNKKLRNKLNSENAIHNGILQNIENPNSITTDILENEYKDTLKTKDKLEDKAKTNVVGITITITLIMGASNVFTNIAKKFSNDIILWTAFILFCVAVLYMLYAGIAAIKILTDENKIYKVSLNNISNEEKLRDDYDISISKNITMNLIRNNGVYTSYECIRNALICLFLVLLLSIFPYAEQNGNREIIEHHGIYDYAFSSNAIECLQNNDIANQVENAVETEIYNNKELDRNKAVGIIDNNNHLFIKFKFDGELISILLVEPYNDI